MGSPGLSKVGAQAMAEGNELLRTGAEFISETDDDFKVGAHAGLVCSLLDELEIAVGLGEEHILNDQEDVLQGRGIDAVTGNRIRTDDIECGQVALTGGVEHLDQV